MSLHKQQLLFQHQSSAQTLARCAPVHMSHAFYLALSTCLVALEQILKLYEWFSLPTLAAREAARVGWKPAAGSHSAVSGAQKASQNASCAHARAA